MWSSAQTFPFIWPMLPGHKRIKGFKRSDKPLTDIKESTIMLWIIPVVLLLLWVIGFWGGFVTTNLIHLLLLGALVLLALNLFSRRRPA